MTFLDIKKVVEGCDLENGLCPGDLTKCQCEQDLFARLTLDSICKVGFGVEIGTLSPSLPEVPFAKAFDIANEAVTYRFFDPFWPLKRYLDIGFEAKLARSVKVVDDFTYTVIQTRRAELEVSSNKGKEMVTSD